MSSVRRLWAKRPGSESKLFAFERNGRVGFIDPTGKIVVEPVIAASIDNVGDFSSGLARVNQQGYRGYVDETARWVIKQDSFDYLVDFSDGLAGVSVRDPNQKFGFVSLIIDVTGRELARVPMFSAGEFSEGLARYEAKGKPSFRRFEPGHFDYRDYPGLKGFVDRTGKIVIQPQFADVGPFSGGLARAVLDGYCHVAMPSGGREGSPTSGYPSSCGGAPDDAVSPCKVGFISPRGNFVIEPRFESAQDFHEKLAAVRIGGLWGFIDTKGTVVIPPRFEQAQSFQEGLAAVKIEGKWGFIDPAGRFHIPARFEDVEPFSDSLAIAYTGKLAFYIDRHGRTQITGPFEEATSFVHGLAAVLLGENHVAYIDHAGKTVFDYVRSGLPRE